jgi:hypothetical protein
MHGIDANYEKCPFDSWGPRQHIPLYEATRTRRKNDEEAEHHV